MRSRTLLSILAAGLSALWWVSRPATDPEVATVVLAFAFLLAVTLAMAFTFARRATGTMAR